MTTSQENKNQVTTVNGFSSVLKKYQSSITHLLQSKYGISPDEFYVSCVNAIKKNPKLLHCDPNSLFGAILLSAECGLRFNTPDQHAFIIPYKGKAQFQIGYKGLIEMMYRSPRVKTIYALAVFEKDEFEYSYGLNPNIIHKPYRGSDKGDLTCVYAICKLQDADPIFIVVEKKELEATREFSSAKDSPFSPYNSGADIHHWMERKTAIKQLSKLIPKTGSPEIDKVIEIDSKFEGEGSTLIAKIPSTPDEIIEPTLIESKKNGISGSFDDAENDKPEPTAIPAQKEEPRNFPEEPRSFPKLSKDKELEFSDVGEAGEKDKELKFELPKNDEDKSGGLFDNVEPSEEEEEED